MLIRLEYTGLEVPFNFSKLGEVWKGLSARTANRNSAFPFNPAEANLSESFRACLVNFSVQVIPTLPGQSIRTFFKRLLYPSLNRLPNTRNRFEIKRLLNGSPVCFAYEHCTAPLSRDEDRFVRTINAVDQPEQRLASFSNRNDVGIGHEQPDNSSLIKCT